MSLKATYKADPYLQFYHPIQKSFDKGKSVTEIAKAFNISETYLNQKVKQGIFKIQAKDLKKEVKEFLKQRNKSSAVAKGLILIPLLLQAKLVTEAKQVLEVCSKLVPSKKEQVELLYHEIRLSPTKDNLLNQKKQVQLITLLAGEGRYQDAAAVYLELSKIEPKVLQPLSRQQVKEVLYYLSKNEKRVNYKRMEASKVAEHLGDLYGKEKLVDSITAYKLALDLNADNDGAYYKLVVLAKGSKYSMEVMEVVKSRMRDRMFSPIGNTKLSSDEREKSTKNAIMAGVLTMDFVSPIFDDLSDEEEELPDPFKGKCVGTLSTQGKALSVIERADGTVAIGLGDHTIKIYSSKGEHEKTLKGHQASVTGLLELSNRTLVSGAYDGEIKIWDWFDKCTHTSNKYTGQHTGGIIDLVKIDDWSFASSCRDKTIKIWSQEGRVINTLEGHKGVIKKMIGGGSFNQSLITSYRKNVKIWSTSQYNSKSCIKTLETDTGVINDVINLPYRGKIITASSDGKIKMWDRQGKLTKTLDAHKASVLCLLNRSDNTFVSSSRDKTVKIWNDRGQCLSTFTLGKPMYQLLELPDGQIAGSNENIMIVLSKDGKSTKILKGHKKRIVHMFLRADGLLVSRSQDGVIKTWE